MKQHFFYIIYIISVIVGSGWYILEQKDTINSQQKAIQDLSASQAPSIVPEKRKVKMVTVKDEKCSIEYEKLRQKTLQCAYNLKFCQESNNIYLQGNNPKTQEKK